MARCSYCSKTISPNAKICPACGEPNYPKAIYTIPFKYSLMFVLFFILLLPASCFFDKISKMINGNRIKVTYYLVDLNYDRRLPEYNKGTKEEFIDLDLELKKYKEGQSDYTLRSFRLREPIYDYEEYYKKYYLLKGQKLDNKKLEEWLIKLLTQAICDSYKKKYNMIYSKVHGVSLSYYKGEPIRRMECR